jgi:DNA-directed RNA polymerase specialized sigma24 family protein
MGNTAEELAGRFEGENAAVRPDNFVQVYEETYEPLVQVAGLIVGDPVSAETIVRDGFVQLYRSWNRVEQPTSYVRSVVVRASCPSGRRRRGRAPTAPAASVTPCAASARQALRALDCPERAAIALRYLEELPEVDIARALGRRPATVRSLLARSVARLSSISTFDTRERLQHGLRSAVEAAGPIVRPSLGELLAGERWERRSFRSRIAVATDRARQAGRTWWSGRDRNGCLPGT